MRLPVLILALAAASTAEAKRPITHEDLWLMPRVAAPAISPDGRLAVVPVTQPAYLAEEQRVDLWLLTVDGSAAPRQITFDAAPEATPTWAPDSRRIVYGKKGAGDEQQQLYLLDLAGGEPVRITSLSTGARSPQVSPDGRRVAFISDVHPEGVDDAAQKAIAEERKARDYNVRVYEGFPIRNWDRWRDEQQAHLHVQTIGQDDPRNLLAGSALVKSPGFGGRGTNARDELDPAWTPDGKALVFVASTNRDRSAWQYTHADLWQVDAAGGEPVRLTGDGNGTLGVDHSRPRFSADGRRLYAQVVPIDPGFGYTATRLRSYAWPDLRQLEQIEGPGGLAISSYATDPDSRTLWFTAEDRGRERLFRARDGRVELWIDQPSGMYTQLASADAARSSTLLALHESANQPPEVVRIDVRQRRHGALTAFTRDLLAELDLAPVEDLWIESDGRRIHSLLLKPPGFDPGKKYPLFVLIHGGPHIMWRDQFFLRWNYHLLAAPGYAVLLTNYRGSTGYGEVFARAIHMDPFKGPADDINRAADAAIEQHDWIDGERQCAGGASYGGHLANWLQGTTTRYRCLVSHAGLVNAEAQWGSSDMIYNREVTAGGPPWHQNEVWRSQNPIRLAPQYRTPVLVTIGELDYRVPLNNTLEYWSALQRQQVESRLVVFPDENHWILKGGNSRYFYREVHDWLERWLGAEQ
jgi:dipeptidyl aminopeptidase/acylaminoacyl peptidase